MNIGTKKNKTLILSSLDIQKVLQHYGIDWTMAALIERMRVTIKNYNSEKTSIPVRGGFHYERPKSGLI